MLGTRRSRVVVRTGLVVSALAVASPAAASAAASCPPTIAGVQPPAGVPGNRLGNPGAEDPTPAPWTLSPTIRVAGYAEGGDWEVAFANLRNLGRQLFATVPGFDGSLTQDLPVADLAGREIQFGGVVAVTGGEPDGSAIEVDALDAGGATVAQATGVSVTPAPLAEGPGSYRSLVGRLVVPAAATVLRVRASLVGSQPAGRVAGIDGLYLTDQTAYGTPPVVPPCPPDQPAPQPQPQPQPSPKRPAATKPSRPRAVIPRRALRHGGRLVVRVSGVPAGRRLSASWRRAGHLRLQQRVAVHARRVRMRVPATAGRYRLEIRYAGRLLGRASLRVR